MKKIILTSLMLGSCLMAKTSYENLDYLVTIQTFKIDFLKYNLSKDKYNEFLKIQGNPEKSKEFIYNNLKENDKIVYKSIESEIIKVRKSKDDKGLSQEEKQKIEDRMRDLKERE